ncbi:MAG: aspartate--tRNA ligase [Candidatus Aenigmarchaeota archaeon]|nr:aspartate--tRNA ligase [Candidatus Aenigmarchaeota archaeon]
MGRYRSHYCIQANNNVGQAIKVAGWVESVRDIGKLVFFVLRDITGSLQVTVKKDSKYFDKAKELSLGDVVSVTGRIAERPEKMKNPKMKTGSVELICEELEVMSKSDRLPFIPGDPNVTEATRLKYRYLDLRRPEMQRNLIFRAKVMNAFREFLTSKGFIEIETPYLAKSTPEGSRDFLVPSRLHPGKFYALAQSPQLYKQILMVSGFDRYFQFPRCFRDEDLRGDRQPEFTQLDLEMSFVDMDDVMSLVEDAVKHVFKKTMGIEIKEIPRLDYEHVIEKYGTDKPDLRIKGLEIVHDGSVKVSLEGYEEKVKDMIGKKSFDNKMKSIEDNYDVKVSRFKQSIANGFVQIEGEKLDSLAAANELRRFIAYATNSIEEGFKVLWVVNFPLFELNEEGQITSAHHPFTSPRDEDLELLDKEPLRVRAKSYDLVINGWEVAGGSIRIHKPEIQAKVFKILGMSEEEYKKRYGFLLEAFKYGVPPHGGIAFGLDRFVAVMLGLNSIRDVIAFPKTKDGVDLMTGSPSEAPEEYLKEFRWLKIEKSKD